MSHHDDLLSAYRTLQLHPAAPQELIAAVYWTLFDRVRLQPELSVPERSIRLERLSAAYRRATAAHRHHLLIQTDAHPPRPRESNASAAETESPDYYGVLGIGEDADADVIETARRVASRARSRSASRDLLDEAYRVLAEPRRRAAYDASRGLLAARHVSPDVTPLPDEDTTDPASREFLLHFGKGAADVAAFAQGHTDALPSAPLAPELSVRRVLTVPQALGFIALACAAGAGFILQPTATAIALVAACSLFYILAIGFKCVLAARSLSTPREVCISVDDVLAMSEADLPVYTVLLPLYREPHMLPQLVQGIQALDYPHHLLDVKLLLEEDDAPTIAAALSMALPDYFDVLVVPSEGPRGKPRACNYGLRRATGQYLVLYDAEDQPEPDQLKKALAAFAAGDGRLACVQAKLDYYNPNQNILTHWFTAEYATWFDLYLPGLNSFGAPIPLGGTSNHFHVPTLREVGAWDPFNVTEDADLGIRLARRGFRTAVVNSTTYEEANSHLGNWLRQRSRWIKGYIQTWLVHSRNPLRSARELGIGGFFAFQMMIFGTFFAYLINPIFWGLLAAWYLTRWSVVESFYPAPLLYLATFALFAGNFAFVYLAMAGALKRGYFGSVKYALFMPVYWALMTAATGRALFQLATRPHYWEKTVHGLIQTAPLPRVLARFSGRGGA